MGLGDLGRKEGYIERQLKRWSTQFEASTTRDLPLVKEVHRRLAERGPRARASRDRARRLPARQLRLQPRRPARRGPRLGAVHARRPAGRPRHARDHLDRGRRRAHRAPDAATQLPGFPTRAEAVARYGERTGRDVSEPRVLLRVPVLAARVHLRRRLRALRGRRDGRPARCGRRGPVTGHAAARGSPPPRSSTSADSASPSSAHPAAHCAALTRKPRAPPRAQRPSRRRPRSDRPARP